VSSAEASVLNCADIGFFALSVLLDRFGLRIECVTDGEVIPGSWFGDREAGLIGDRLYLRADTPVHSALHEACHWICMDDERRAALHTDAGGDEPEECATCYLQLLLAAYLPGFGFERALADMDAWGYSFRLGSARAWFNEDAADARNWLLRHGLIDSAGQVLWQVRREPVNPVRPTDAAV